MNESSFFRYFMYRLGRLKGFLIASCLFSLLSYPLLSASVLAGAKADAYRQQMYDQYGYDSAELYAAQQACENWNGIMALTAFIAVVSLIVLFSLGYFILLKNFRYNHDKVYTDMALTLPVSHRDRFFGDFLSGLAVYAIPHIAAVAVGYLMIPVICDYIDTDNSITSITSMLKDAMLTGFFACLLLYCSTVLIMSVTGRKFEAVTLPLLMNVCVSALMLFAGIAGLYDCYGITSGSIMSEMPGFLEGSTPLGLLLSFFLYLNGRSSLGDENAFGFMVPELIVWILLYCAAFTAAAYLLAMKRQAQRTGSAYVFGGVRHVVQAVEVVSATVPVFLLLLSDEYIEIGVLPLILLWLIGTLAAFFISEAVTGTRLRKIPFAVLRYVCCAAGGIVLTLALMNCNGFGAVSYIPQEGSVSSCIVRFSGGHTLYYGEPKELAPVTELHEELVRQRPDRNNEYDNYYGFNVDMSYILNNGRVIRRYYTFGTDYARSVFDAVTKSGIIDRVYTLPDSLDGKVTELTLSAANYNYRQEAILRGHDLTMQMLQQALTEDSRRLTFDRLFKEGYRYPCSMSVKFRTAPDEAEINKLYPYGYNKYSSASFRIYPFFESTLSLLKDYGIDPDWGDYDYDNVYLIKRTTSKGICGSDWFDSNMRSDIYSESGDPGFVRKINPDTDELSGLISHCAPETLYENMGAGSADAYAVLIRVNRAETGAESYNVLPVTEAYLGKAGELWEKGNGVSRNELKRLLNM